MNKKIENLCVHACQWRHALGIILMAASVAASASPVWMEDNDLQSELDDNLTYWSDATTRTGVVSFTNQTATNNGATPGHFGMYLGWAWSYDSLDNEIQLPWDNVTQAFTDGTVSLAVTRPSFGAQSLLLADVVGDTWIGIPWPVSYPGAITTHADWNVPFFDFGDIDSGASLSYDITLTFTFANEAAFKDWDSGGSFYLGGQGVRAVPEPGSFALIGLGLLGLSIAARRRA